MGGVGSGNWYRIDKKTTAGETHSGLSSIKRYARMVPSIVNLGQGRPTCRDGEDCAPPPDRSLPKCNNPPMVLPRQQFAETALETATSPDRGASSCLWWHTRTERRVWVSHPQVGP